MVKCLSRRRFWQRCGLWVGCLMVGYLLVVLTQPAPGSLDAKVSCLQAENRRLKRYLQQQQQQYKTLVAQYHDLATLNHVRQQINQELLQGNALLQQQISALQKDLPPYPAADALGSKR